MIEPHQAQDPDELFDVLRSDGTSLGFAKKRSEVHRDGDWHRAVHIWIYGVRNGGSFLLFQRRSELKDTSPGKLDPTVGGHYRTGEKLSATLREIEEEIGIPAVEEELRFAGVRLCSNEREKGIIDREIQDVFFWRNDRPLTDFKPNPHELAGLLRVPLDRLLDFGAGERSSIESVFLASGSSRVEPIQLSKKDFAPTIDLYSYRVAIAARALLNGEDHVAV